MNTREDKEERLTLELLTAIDGHSDVSQRHLARNMGVALGLANSYLKRCVRKGYIKIREAPANRFLYYLTPKGFAEKSRLTARYLSTSLEFYRQAAESCSQAFELCRHNGWERVLLCGKSDLAEIALLRAMESNIDIVGVYAPGSKATEFFSKPVWAELAGVNTAFHIGLVTDLKHPARTYKELVGALGEARVLVPQVLGIQVAGNGQ